MSSTPSVAVAFGVSLPHLRQAAGQRQPGHHRRNSQIKPGPSGAKNTHCRQHDSLAAHPSVRVHHHLLCILASLSRQAYNVTATPAFASSASNPMVAKALGRATVAEHSSRAGQHKQAKRHRVASQRGHAVTCFYLSHFFVNDFHLQLSQAHLRASASELRVVEARLVKRVGLLCQAFS